MKKKSDKATSNGIFVCSNMNHQKQYALGDQHTQAETNWNHDLTDEFAIPAETSVEENICTEKSPVVPFQTVNGDTNTSPEAKTHFVPALDAGV